MTTREKNLIIFAEFTLKILENQEEWTGETADDIGNKAIALGLATTDENSQFVRK